MSDRKVGGRIPAESVPPVGPPPTADPNSSDGADVDTVTVPAWALDSVLAFVRTDPALAFTDADSTVLDAVMALLAVHNDIDHFCELCSFPYEADYRADAGAGADGTAGPAGGDGEVFVCAYHADALEAGAWDGDEHSVVPVGDRGNGQDKGGASE